MLHYLLVYQMAPRSWRPESSLGDNVPLSDIKLEDNFQALTLAYSYSGQISGQATEWRPSSSQSRYSVLAVSQTQILPHCLVHSASSLDRDCSQMISTTFLQLLLLDFRSFNTVGFHVRHGQICFCFLLFVLHFIAVFGKFILSYLRTCLTNVMLSSIATSLRSECPCWKQYPYW